MASATFVQGNSSHAFSSSTTRAVSYSSPTSPGNLLFVMAVAGHTTTFTISDTSSNAWVALSTGLNSSSVSAVQAWYCLNANGGANTVTITDATSGSTNRYIAVGEWTGGTFIALDQQHVANLGFGISSANTGNVVTQDATDVLIGYFFISNTGRTFSSSGGDTIEFTDGTGQICFTDQNTTVTGTYSQAVTWTGGSSGCACGIAAIQILPYTSFNTTVGRFNDAGGLIGSLIAPIWTSVNIVPVTVSANSTSDQSLMLAIIPANTLNKYGRTLRIHLSGVYTTPGASTATLEFKVELGSLTLINITSTANAGSITNNKWFLDAYVSTQTNGTSAAFESSGNLTIDLGAATTTAMSTFADLNTSTVGTLDITAQQTLQITIAFSAGSTSNICTQRQLILNTVN